MEQRIIKTSLSQKDLRFQPGGSPVSFDVLAINTSDRFSTFQIEVLAAGVETTAGNYWYRLTPDVSAKTPPGDVAAFSITILDTPKPGFIGTMNLFVKVYSLELRQEERENLRLTLELPKNTIPFKVDLSAPLYTVAATESVEIALTVTNLAPFPADALLRCTGLPAGWLLEGTERRVQIQAGRQVQTQFLCQIPIPTQAPSTSYPFTIEAIQQDGTTSKGEGSVRVKPSGAIEFACPIRDRTLPNQQNWLPHWKTKTTSFPLEWSNQGNLVQQVTVQVSEEPDQPKCQLHLEPPELNLEIGATDQQLLFVQKQRHWFGMAKKCAYEVKASVVSNPALPLPTTTHRLKLKIQPILPLWLQGLGLLALLWLLWWLSWLNPHNPFWGHRDVVNSVKFDGIGDHVISGASDRTILKWRVNGFLNPLVNQHMGKIGKTHDLAVRVVRYRPVNNDRLAAGLENGEIQIWSALTGNRSPLQTFFAQKDDRVLDLAFSRDSRVLLSGHGSGAVVQWDLGSQALPQQSKGGAKIVNKIEVGFPVYAIAWVGGMEQTVAIAGGRNRVVLWHLPTQTLRELSPDWGTQSDYIFSIATAEEKQTLLATANNRGLIQIWNLQPCLSSNSACERVDQWHADPIAVHSVALSADGCYLASGGESGKTMLWSLTPRGNRSAQQQQGKQLNHSGRSINAVDITRRKDELLIARGGDDTQVNVYHTTVNDAICP